MGEGKMALSVKSVGATFPSSYSTQVIKKNKMNGSGDARSAPTSPDKTVPVIDRSKVSPEVLQAAEGMESMFLDYMMKVMRQTVPKNDMDLESPATEIYRGMMDSEYAQKIAHQGGVGLADQLIAYLETRGYNLPQGQAAQVEVKKAKEKP